MKSSHLLPFLWLHGENDDALRRGVQAIRQSGCDTFCAESRVHPDYLGPGWWHEMGVLMAECKKLGMRFYLLDDAHFPSGFANGAGANTPWQRMLLRETHADFAGPLRGGRILAWPDGQSGIPAAIVAGRKLETGNRVESFVDLGGFAVADLMDLTDRVKDGLIRWDIPEGTWRVFYLTADYVSERNPPQQFLNPLLPDSGRLMLETIYRPHAAFFGEETGRAFLGFFSDEPALRAGRGSHAVLGEYPNLPVPWREDMAELLSRRMGRDARPLLPGLWYDIGAETPFIRYAFMDLCSELYRKNYADPIGNWCRERGLEYIGHVIEQNNAHSRLGQGAGHFFRALSGQTMAGMDLVHHELRPEFYGGHHASHSRDFEAEDDFFRFMLPQMTASAAALDTNKKGRALCELFGAYGWQESPGEMRYLANLLLSRGINYFTPHAFSLNPAPDPDSPPHFGAYPPMEPFIARLFGQMEKVAALIDGGRHAARAAVLYYAEAEWACGSGVMKTQQIVRVLNESQIACEIVPIDLLSPGRYQALLIPGAQRWPQKLFEKLRALSAAGCAVAFVEEYPSAYCDAAGAPPRAFHKVPLAQAAKWCSSVSSSAVQPLSFSPMVHAYPYDRPQGRLFLFFNESSRESSAFTGELEGVSSPVLYDPEAEKCFSHQGEATARGYRVSLTLSPGQLVILTQPLPQLPKAEQARKLLEGKSLTPCWRVSFPDAPEMQDFHTSQLFDIASCFPRFAGTVRYEAEVMTDCACFGLRIKNQFDAARVWVDGREAGMRMSPPYDFFLSLSPGRHTITIETVNAPVYRWRDPLSIHGWLPPVGLLGPVVLLTDASAGS